ncbi:AT-hook motif nuclear-localized protein 1-like [Rhododendron vialii]|uniref:AT-hook motif nuclear-localized protein 1-like n=1 Tax=Rhododendron vialii TaxID=182163 RepID=UPI00265F067B|nr:AT-hook motif nuclear-localized protein 1-like [Rhododendron vialii]
MQYVSINGRGRFELLTLSGSYTCTATGNVQREIGRLSVSLANPDGSVFGGTVVGSLVAAMPIQLILGSFKQNIKLQLLRRHSTEPSTAMGSPSVSDRAKIPTPTAKLENVEENSVSTPNGDENTISDHNLTRAFLQNSDQNGSQPSDPVSDEKTSMGSSSVLDRVQIPKPTAKLENVEENSVSTPNGDENTISDHNLTHAFLQNSDQNGSQPSDLVSDEKALT